MDHFYVGLDIYIDQGTDAVEENERIFDILYGEKEEVERATGGLLV